MTPPTPLSPHNPTFVSFTVYKTELREPPCHLQRASLSANAEQTPTVISFELQLKLLQKVQIFCSE